MKYIIIIAALMVLYFFNQKGKNTNVNATSPSVSDDTGYNDYQDVRLILHISKKLPINWGSHHSGLGYVGDAAIVNSDYITAIDLTANRKWDIRLDNISRYAIERNNKNKWVHIRFYTKDGSQEVMVIKENEVARFEEAYESAVKTFYEMEEFMAQN